MSFELSSYPVSGHGLHSRRASDKDGSRRAPDVPFPNEDHDHRRLSSEAIGSAGLKRGSTAWIMDIELDRGSWDCTGGCLFGVRKLPRSTHLKSRTTKPRPSDGLSLATLDRWEAWKFDPSTDTFASSALGALYSRPPSRTTRTSSSNQDTVPRLPFTRVAPFVARSSHIVSGFGNTVGILRNL